MAFEPQSLGLPPFIDLVHGVIPMDVPLRIRGTVVKGFGRGSKVRRQQGEGAARRGGQQGEISGMVIKGIGRGGKVRRAGQGQEI